MLRIHCVPEANPQIKRTIHRRGGFAGLVLGTALAMAPGLGFGQLPSGTWQYAWGDDFSGNTLDQSKWSYNYPWGVTHNHNATMNAGNVRFGDGSLTLVAERTGSGANDFKSGAISTGYTKKTFSGGYIEARIQLPDTPGSWPAFWGLYTGWPPEMDIMEYPIDTAGGVGYAQDEYHTAFHYKNSSGGDSSGGGKVNPGGVGDLGGTYHTFGVNWVKDSSVTFYFDGNQVSSFSSGGDVAEMAYMYLILNYAVGGWPGTPNTTEWPVGHSDQMKVDWVRVWTSAASKNSNWIYPGAEESVQWDNSSHWSNGIPNLGGVTSSFGTLAPATQRIDWSGAKMLSVINLDGSTRYRLGGQGDRLVLGFGNGGSIQPSINLAATTTSEQEIYGDLEWSGSLSINNDSAQPLLLTGKVMGGNGVFINGPGVVSFDGPGSYSGTTVIDSGAQGPGIARARNRNALGIGGLVVIGEQGNGTTGRLELENNSLVSNQIHLNGRNTATAGIVNNSGINAISGTIFAQSGGSNYWLQSDGGKLRLLGGTAMTSGAGGTRTFTLQGAAEGQVSGAIADGNATVNIVKSGSGIWTFDAPNTYTGTTTVSQGTLVVNGSTGSGGTTVGNGAALGGRGTVRNSLSAAAGSIVRAGGDGMSPAFKLIDNFSSYPVGDIGATPNTTSDVWTGVFDGTANADIVDVSGNRALAVNGTNASSGWRGAITDLKSRYADDFSLPHGQTGTYFFRVRRTGAVAIDAIFGLSDQAASTSSAPGNDTSSPWDEYAIMLSIFGDSTNSMLRAYDTGDNDVNVTPVTTDQWLNVWVTVDNAAKTFRVATSSGANAGIDSGRSYDFGRRTGGTVGNKSLVTFGIHEAKNVAVQMDDFHFASGANLSNPLAAVSPLASETLTVENGFTLESGAAVEFDIASPGLHDKLVIGGAFNAMGTLRVKLDASGSAPALDDSFDLFDSAGGVIGFASYELPTLAEGLKWDTSAIGTGEIRVVADTNSYAGWTLEHPFTPGTDGPAHDAENDGVPNAFEWLFGIDPFVANADALPKGKLRAVNGDEFPGANPAKEYLSIRATIRKSIAGMTLIPQAAPTIDLLNAPDSSGSVVSRLLNDLGDFEEREWIYTVPVGDSSRGFMRLKLIED